MFFIPGTSALMKRMCFETSRVCTQLLYRDLTSSSDIVGPLLFSSRTMESRTLWPCVYETMRLFRSYALKIMALIMYGASYNLLLIQYMCHRRFGAKAVMFRSNIPTCLDSVLVLLESTKLAKVSHFRRKIRKRCCTCRSRRCAAREQRGAREVCFFFAVVNSTFLLLPVVLVKDRCCFVL